MKEFPKNTTWRAKIYDGKVDGTNYQYSPHVSISSNGEKGRHVAEVALVSVGYNGDEEARAISERNARLIHAAPELEALLVSICSIPALHEIEERNSKLRAGGHNMVTEALALLDWIRKGETNG